MQSGNFMWCTFNQLKYFCAQSVIKGKVLGIQRNSNGKILYILYFRNWFVCVAVSDFSDSYFIYRIMNYSSRKSLVRIIIKY